MTGEVGLLIQELRHACRQSLFNGISGVANSDGGGGGANRDSTKDHGCSEKNVVYPESETGSTASSQKVAASSNKRARREVAPSSDATKWTRSWDTILADASKLLPIMTDQEHGQVSKLTGILLLGFLLPHSTGNDFFLLQNISNNRVSGGGRNRAVTSQYHQLAGAHTSEETDDMDEYILQMSLEERLESCSHRYHPDEFGEFHTVVFEPLEFAFQLFLDNALRQFLRNRPCHTKEVDLLHILAMAIHPQPSEQSIRETAATLEQRRSKPWEATKCLMTSLVPHSFHLNYHHRLQLVDLVTNCLVIPGFRKERGSYDASLTEGALPHLRASLYAFGMAASSPYDAHMAQCGMVALAIQSGIDAVVKDEWSRLLHRMVDDRTNYRVCQFTSDDFNCGSRRVSSKTLSSTSMLSLDQRSNNPCFCPHRARGELLSGFLTRYNEARHFAEEEFLQYALASLTDAIEMQVDCWTRECDEEGGEKANDDDIVRTGDTTIKDGEKVNSSTNYPPCVLASLLYAAKNLFYFLLPIKKDDQDSQGGQGGPQGDEEEVESEESQRRDMLVSCGIQLVHHWDPTIAEEACNLVVLAFSYTEAMWEDYVGAVFESTKIAIDFLLNRVYSDATASIAVPIEGMISTFSQRSLIFAGNVFRLLLNKVSPEVGNPVVIFRLMAAVATACPVVAQKYREILVRNLNEFENSAVKSHVVVSILACRKALYFGDDDDSSTAMLLDSSAALGGWDKYLVARQALLTGNYTFAKHMYNQLMDSASSESSFVWLSALEKISEGAAALAIDGAQGLLDAASSLRKAMITLRCLSSLNGSLRKGGFSAAFQIRWLGLRVSFLDLLTSIRQLSREMRLTGVGPKKLTRPHLHLKNIIKSFDGLGFKYEVLCREFGLFVCQQTRSALRTLQILCIFVAKASRKVFVDSLPEVVPHKKSHEISQGDASQPLTSLMNQLQSIALNDMDNSVDAKIRAAAMLEILDGVLKVSLPVPKALTITQAISPATVQIVWDPDEHSDMGLHDESDSMTFAPNSFMSFLASGRIPESMLERAQLQFTIILLWVTIKPKGKQPNPLTQDTHDSAASDTRTKPSQSYLLNPAPVATSMSSSGTYFTKVRMSSNIPEGRYEIRFRLGCRDIRGGEWNLPLIDDPRCFSVKIIRSNS